MTEDMSQKASARERIVQAATLLFWRNGYHPVSTDAICKAAAVGRSSLYHAFPSKAHILGACLDRVWERNWREIREAYAGDDLIEVKFRRHLDWFRHSQLRLRAEGGVLLGTFDMALGVALPSDVVDRMREHQAQHHKLIETSVSEIFRQRGHAKVDLTRITDIINSLIVASTYRARLLNDEVALGDLPLLAQSVIDVFSRQERHADPRLPRQHRPRRSTRGTAASEG